MTPAGTSRTVRISTELYNQVSKICETAKPRTTKQYFVEQAIIEYIADIKEKGGPVVQFDLPAAADPPGPTYGAPPEGKGDANCA